MTKRRVIGPCHICGIVCELSYEHVPPRAAFNDHPVRVIKGEAVIRADLDSLPRGVQQQRGAGEYTLCARCNNNTGAWYAKSFASFTWQAAEVLLATRGQASLFYTFHIFPARVLKQIICMFMSANGPGFAEAQPELVRFVLNKWAAGIPDNCRIYAYYNAGDRGRLAGVTGMLDTTTRHIRVLSEITFPPLGYVLSLKGEPPDSRLVEITHFGRALHDDFRHVDLRLPVLPVFTYFPGDYRDRDTVITDRERNANSDS